MPDAEPPNPLPLASVEAILVAAGRSPSLAPAAIERIRRWLESELARAIRRARAAPLTKGDVDRLERRYLRFRSMIEKLQDRDDPPPQMSRSESGVTDWEHWLSGQLFGFKRGRRESSDWRLIAALIALYEIISERDASASQPDGPTMRFLIAALRELADYAPPELRSRFAPPNAEALKQQLPRLRESDVSIAAKRLAEMISAPSG